MQVLKWHLSKCEFIKSHFFFIETGTYNCIHHTMFGETSRDVSNPSLRRLEMSQINTWDPSRRLTEHCMNCIHGTYRYVMVRTGTYNYIHGCSCTYLYVLVGTSTYTMYVPVRTCTYLYVKNGGDLCHGTYLCMYRYVHYNVVWYMDASIQMDFYPRGWIPIYGWISIHVVDIYPLDRTSIQWMTIYTLDGTSIRKPSSGWNLSAGWIPIKMDGHVDRFHPYGYLQDRFSSGWMDAFTFWMEAPSILDRITICILVK